jgi:UDP-2,4-diacetamido-2,4,6-trideoxy-beta-L-altropyranose hydrolase
MEGGHVGNWESFCVAMNIVFRADASTLIGAGHVMRCLTLAQNLRVKGHNCHFICREHPGNLIGLISAKGFYVSSLPYNKRGKFDDLNEEAGLEKGWLGSSWQYDADLVVNCIEKLQADWLIVDHYALDINWESKVRPYVDKIFAIDDLSNRAHSCEILLDQTFGKHPVEYQNLVPRNCRLLVGSEYALLRPEFAKLRGLSLSRRQNKGINSILVTLGGVDRDNITGIVIEAIRLSGFAKNTDITVVMGKSSPWIEEIQTLASDLDRITVKVDVSNMAELMKDSDLCIGAAGSTAWERCCLGLPSIMLVLADNQKEIALQLNNAGAAILCKNSIEDISDALLDLYEDQARLIKMGRIASAICDGIGVERAVLTMEQM